MCRSVMPLLACLAQLVPADSTASVLAGFAAGWDSGLGVT